MAISLIHFKRLPRPFRARNDIVKYIAFVLVYPDKTKMEDLMDHVQPGKSNGFVGV